MVAEPSSDRPSLGALLREDMRDLPKPLWWAIIRFGWMCPGCTTTLLYRLSAASARKNSRLGYIVSKLIWRINIIFTACHIEAKAEIGPGLELPHPTGIVIGPCIIGKHATIYQNVTIGMRHSKNTPPEERNYPIIGDNVRIYAGAVIIGGIRIGDNVHIGANAVVTSDIPDNHVARGIPAKAYPLQDQA